MKQKYSYGDCYKILAVKPDCSWDELRKAYKLQIKKWHPDRFKANTAEKQAADDKIKYITAAYKQLSEYHREHNRLPVIETGSNVQPSPSTNFQKNVTNKASDTVSFKTKPSTYKTHFLLRVIIIIILIGLLLKMYLAETSDTVNDIPYKGDAYESAINSTNTRPAEKIDKQSTARNESHGRSSLQNQRELVDGPLAGKTSLIDSSKENKATDEFFTYGSTIGEVITIQGAPDKVDGDTWYYGESEVYFYNGAVVNWKRSADSHLKARVIIDDTQNISSEETTE